MKWVPLAAVATMVALTPEARGDDLVRECIAASTEGQTLRNQGRLLAARAAMISCARDACPQIVRAHCAKWLAEVEGATPSLVVRVEDSRGGDAIGARLSIDGQPAKLDGRTVRLDPGEHRVAVEGPLGERKEEQVLLLAGESSRVVTLRLPPPAVVAPAPRVPLGAWVLGGAGVALLGSATYFGLAANSALHDLQTTCSPMCTESQTQAGRNDALLFDLTLGAGAAAVAGAVVWGLLFPSTARDVGATVHVDIRPTSHGSVTALTLSY